MTANVRLAAMTSPSASAAIPDLRGVFNVAQVINLRAQTNSLPYKKE
jgi:hypothetical protein